MHAEHHGTHEPLEYRGALARDHELGERTPKDVAYDAGCSGTGEDGRGGGGAEADDVA